jgi:DNA-directed RNA polymerase specialized sigma24 family protein
MNVQPSTRVRAQDRLRASGLRARHGDLISLYVHRRTESPQEATRIIDEVFRAAAEHHDRLPEHPLPWLIATARHECATARHSASPAPARHRTPVRRPRIA